MSTRIQDIKNLRDRSIDPVTGSIWLGLYEAKCIVDGTMSLTDAWSAYCQRRIDHFRGLFEQAIKDYRSIQYPPG